MANSTTNVDQVSQSQSQHEVPVNALNDAASMALTFGRRWKTCIGLTWGYYGGNASVGGTPTFVSNGTVTLTASNTNYVYADLIGSPSTWTVIATTSAPSGWPGPLSGSKVALYTVVTNTTGVDPTSGYTDHRLGAGAAAIAGISIPGTPTGTGFRHVTSGSEDAAARAVDVSTSDVTGTLAGARMPALTGDVTTSAGAVATTIASDAVTNAKLANVATSTFKGRTTAGTGDPEDLTVTQAQTLLNPISLNTQSGTNYTLVLSDAGLCVEMNNASANELVIPANSSVAFPTGTVILIRQMGVGVTQVDPGAGVTLRCPGTLQGSPGSYTLRAQYAMAVLHKRAADEWVFDGDIA